MTKLAYAFSKLVCWLLFRLRFGLRVSGQAHVPQCGGVLVACNHTSFLDPPVLGAACPRPLRFMARADLFSGTLGMYMRSVGVISLKRGEADPSAVRAAVAALRRGEAVAIFPEGGRQLSGRIGQARRGVGLLAELARVPIVPAFIQGTSQALPPHTTRLQRAKIRVAFGTAIPYTYFPIPGPASTPGASRSAEGEPGFRASRVHHEQLAEAVTQAWRRLEAGARGAAAPTPKFR